MRRFSHRSLKVSPASCPNFRAILFLLSLKWNSQLFMRLRASSPKTCRGPFMLAPAMSVHQPWGLNTVLLSPETFRRPSLKRVQNSAMFSEFSCSVSITARGICLFSSGWYTLAVSVTKFLHLLNFPSKKQKNVRHSCSYSKLFSFYPHWFYKQEMAYQDFRADQWL